MNLQDLGFAKWRNIISFPCLNNENYFWVLTDFSTVAIKGNSRKKRRGEIIPG